MKIHNDTATQSGGIIAASRQGFDSLPFSYRALIAASVGLMLVVITLVAVNTSL
jgi:hypothetical protein